MSRKSPNVANINDFWNTYKSDVEGVVTEVTDQVDSFTATKEYLAKRLEDYREILETSGIEVDRVLNSSNVEILSKFTKCVFIIPVLSGRKLMLSLEGLTKLTRTIIATNKLIKRSKRRIGTVSADGVSEVVYNDVLTMFGQEVRAAILEKGYAYSIGGGNVTIIGKDMRDKTPIICWHKSNRKKEEIIAKGGIPYKAIRDNRGNIISDNGGEEWLVRFEAGDVYTWTWMGVSVGRVPNANLYTFKPSMESKERLTDIKNNHPELLANYTRVNYKKDVPQVNILEGSNSTSI